MADFKFKEVLPSGSDGGSSAGFNEIKKKYFTNYGVITFDGVVDNSALMSGKAHTDIIPIDILANGEEGYCVQHFDDFGTYPKVLFFAGKTLDTLVGSLTSSEIGYKNTLKAEEIKALAPSNATHVAFNSDYEESSEEDFVYVYKFATIEYVENAVANAIDQVLGVIENGSY